MTKPDRVKLKYIDITWQTGTRKDVGANGTQPEEVIDVCRTQLRVLNNALDCPETNMAIALLAMAGEWLQMRTRDRESRGVEGTFSA